MTPESSQYFVVTIVEYNPRILCISMLYTHNLGNIVYQLYINKKWKKTHLPAEWQQWTAVTSSPLPPPPFSDLSGPLVELLH